MQVLYSFKELQVFQHSFWGWGHRTTENRGNQFLFKENLVYLLNIFPFQKSWVPGLKKNDPHFPNYCVSFTDGKTEGM